MILRVYALYGHSLRVLIFLMTLWVVQLVMGFIGIANGFRMWERMCTFQG